MLQICHLRRGTARTAYLPFCLVYTESIALLYSQHQFCKGGREPRLAVMYIDTNGLAWVLKALQAPRTIR